LIRRARHEKDVTDESSVALDGSIEEAGRHTFIDMSLVHIRPFAI